MKFSRYGLAICSLLAPLVSWGQVDVVGAVVGSLSGSVQNEAGELVSPESSVQATIVASDSSGALMATITGTASTAGALGMSIVFNADFDVTTGGFVGLYADKPGGTPNLELVFSPVGGLSWAASISGTAPSATGERSYDLSLQFSIPEAAIFQGDQLPGDKVFSGSLSATIPISAPLVVPIISLNQDLNFDYNFTGSWTATTVPQDDGSTVLTGHASGTFNGDAGEITVSVPLLGDLTLPTNFDGTFAGNLFSVSETELAFRGSWTAASLDQNFGGDFTITIPLTNASTFPFELTGTLPMQTGIALQPVFNMPLELSGSFPLNMASP